jgi:Arc/MetJ family transcription regulator
VKRRTTVYLDDELLRAARVQAAREGKHDYEVFEAALRRYLGFDVIDRVRARNAGVSETGVLAASQAALAEVRAERRKNRGSRPA